MMLAMTAMTAMIALAQPVEPEQPPGVNAMCEFYQSQSFAEQIQLTFTDRSGQEQMLGVVFRRSLIDDKPVSLIELPGVRFSHRPGVLLGERTGQGNHAVVLRIESGNSFVDALSAIVPLWPMPQLWTISGDSSVRDPSLGEIRITGLDESGPTWILTGSSSAGDVTLEISPITGRALSLSADLRDGSVRAIITPLAPVDPEQWEIRADQRWVVTQLSQLALAGPPLRAGGKINDLDLLTPQYQGIDLSEIQTLERIRESGPWVVLLIVNADAEQTAFDLAGQVAAGLWSQVAIEVAGLDTQSIARYWLGHRSLIIAVSSALEVLPDRAEQLGHMSPQGVPILISTEPEKTLDRLETTATVTAVLVDPSQNIGAVVPIETAEIGTSAVLDAMRSYTREALPVNESD